MSDLFPVIRFLKKIIFAEPLDDLNTDMPFNLSEKDYLVKLHQDGRANSLAMPSDKENVFFSMGRRVGKTTLLREVIKTYLDKSDTDDVFRTIGLHTYPVPTRLEQNVLNIDNPKKLRGHRLDLLISDECFCMTEEHFLAVTPQLQDSLGRMILFGTPVGAEGFMNDLFSDSTVPAFRLMIPASHVWDVSKAYSKHSSILDQSQLDMELEALVPGVSLRQ